MRKKPWEWRQSFLAKEPGRRTARARQNRADAVRAYSISEYIAEQLAAACLLVRRDCRNCFRKSRRNAPGVRRLVDWFHGKFDREVSDLLFEKVYQRMSATGAAPDPACCDVR
jgi:glutathione S-transferase